jgi:neutral ceramidase
MKTFRTLLRFAAVGLLVCGGLFAADVNVWRAGAASARITPEKPMWMAGYAGRTGPSEGVELDLYAKVLVLTDAEKNRAAFVTLDLIGVPRSLRLSVAEQAEKRFGISPSHLVLNASHTHSGPELKSSRLYGVDDVPLREREAAEYVAKLETTLLRLIGEAIEGSRSATVDFCSARCGFAMNRRTPDGKGGWKNFPNPAGPVDHRVPVLRVNGTEGGEIAVMFGYACHCTTLGHQKFSGDYAGYAKERIETAHPGVVALFMNGCSGDQNPYPRRTVELAETHGTTLATAVEAALTTTLRPVAPSLRAAYGEIPIEYERIPSRAELEEERKSKDKWTSVHAERVLRRLDEDGSLPKEYPYPVQVLRLGRELTWVTLGGEVVIDYVFRIERELQESLVWVSGYSNDVMGYIPSRRVWDEGGYEAGGAMVYGTHPSRWASSVEERIIAAVRTLRAALP